MDNGQHSYNSDRFLDLCAAADGCPVHTVTIIAETFTHRDTLPVLTVVLTMLTSLRDGTTSLWTPGWTMTLTLMRCVKTTAPQEAGYLSFHKVHLNMDVSKVDVNCRATWGYWEIQPSVMRSVLQSMTRHQSPGRWMSILMLDTAYCRRRRNTDFIRTSRMRLGPLDSSNGRQNGNYAPLNSSSIKYGCIGHFIVSGMVVRLMCTDNHGLDECYGTR